MLWSVAKFRLVLTATLSFETALMCLCIQAPIIPHTSSVDDTRHFLHLPLPPAEEIPCLIREEKPPALHQRFDPIAYQFLEF